MVNKVLQILIVDDERDLCFLLKNTLKTLLSGQIDVCYSVKDAFEHLKNNTYDIAFFDYQLGDGTGLELVEFVHKEVEIPPYIIAMSANATSQQIDKLKQTGAEYFIPKPLSKEKVYQSIEGFL